MVWFFIQSDGCNYQVLFGTCTQESHKLELLYDILVSWEISPLCYWYLNTLLSASMFRAHVYLLYHLAFIIIAVDVLQSLLSSWTGALVLCFVIFWSVWKQLLVSVLNLFVYISPYVLPVLLVPWTLFFEVIITGLTNLLVFPSLNWDYTLVAICSHFFMFTNYVQWLMFSFYYFYWSLFFYCSLSALIENKIFSVHGGLSPAISTLDQVHEAILIVLENSEDIRGHF